MCNFVTRSTIHAMPLCSSMAADLIGIPCRKWASVVSTCVLLSESLGVLAAVIMLRRAIVRSRAHSIGDREIHFGNDPRFQRWISWPEADFNVSNTKEVDQRKGLQSTSDGATQRMSERRSDTTNELSGHRWVCMCALM